MFRAKRRWERKESGQELGESLDPQRRSGEDGIRITNAMRLPRLAPARLFIAVLVMLQTFAGAGTTHAQGKGQTPAGPTSRVTIEVSGGESETPVENASVYIKYVEERKIR